jgi:hypothetical protein
MIQTLATLSLVETLQEVAGQVAEFSRQTPSNRSVCEPTSSFYWPSPAVQQQRRVWRG